MKGVHIILNCVTQYKQILYISLKFYPKTIGIAMYGQEDGVILMTLLKQPVQRSYGHVLRPYVDK